MALNQSKFNVDWCVAGEKRFQELDPRQFKATSPVCPKCDQPVQVKKDGFYKRHKASSAGYKSMGDTRSGTPARVRRTR